MGGALIRRGARCNLGATVVGKRSGVVQNEGAIIGDTGVKKEWRKGIVVLVGWWQ